MGNLDLFKTIFKERFKGSPGSGNWGHVGVPGHWGGSAPKGSGGPWGKVEAGLHPSSVMAQKAEIRWLEVKIGGYGSEDKKEQARLKAKLNQLNHEFVTYINQNMKHMHVTGVNGESGTIKRAYIKKYPKLSKVAVELDTGGHFSLEVNATDLSL